MRYLPELPLKPSLQRHLERSQALIDPLPSYYAKVKQAKIAWQLKKKSTAQKAAFGRIEQALQAAGHHCHYCEHTLGTSIEHFFPRGFYPELTFVWDHYLWSCKACNTRYKGAQFQLFEGVKGTSTIDLVKNRRFVPPPHQIAVCLHPRQDDGLNYWNIEEQSGRYVLKEDLDERARIRALYTLRLLQLNDRPALLKGRLETFKRIQHLLTNYIKLQQVPSDTLIRHLLPNKSNSFYQQPMPQQQQAAFQKIRRSIENLPHQSVWRYWKNQYAHLSPWRIFFE